METQLSPYLLLRKAGLPYRHLADARPSETWAKVSEIQNIETRIAALRESLDPLCLRHPGC